MTVSVLRIGNGEDVAVLIIGVADRILIAHVAGHTAKGIVEVFPLLPSGIGKLLTQAKLVIGVGQRTARGSGGRGQTATVVIDMTI